VLKSPALRIAGQAIKYAEICMKLNSFMASGYVIFYELISGLVLLIEGIKNSRLDIACLGAAGQCLALFQVIIRFRSLRPPSLKK
jgi:hypothetical protein